MALRLTPQHVALPYAGDARPVHIEVYGCGALMCALCLVDIMPKEKSGDSFVDEVMECKCLSTALDGSGGGNEGAVGIQSTATN